MFYLFFHQISCGIPFLHLYYILYLLYCITTPTMFDTITIELCVKGRLTFVLIAVNSKLGKETYIKLS